MNIFYYNFSAHVPLILIGSLCMSFVFPSTPEEDSERGHAGGDKPHPYYADEAACQGRPE